MAADRVKLLADSAELARRLAPESCWRDPASGKSCASYHGFWPFMRLLDYGSSPELHAEVFHQALAPLATRGTPARVLVSGTADFTMLEVARQALAGAKVPPRFVAIDRCDTPLALSRHFAEQAGFELETRAADILGFEDAEGFDAIVTHSFLGFFAPELRRRLMRRWFALLRPGGCLVTINRLRGEKAPATTVFTADDSDAFVARLAVDLKHYRDVLESAEEDLTAMARAYLQDRQGYPVRTREELAALFEDAGFVLEVFEELETGDPGKARPTGPTMPGGATYMKIVARRAA